jgi:TetR/AcrR family transcriptional regulator, mexJK operon transcriptional repressor
VATRRSMLLAVAGRLFLQNGFHGVSLATIAREAHVALRTIYLGFGDKAGLLAAVQADAQAAFARHYDLLDPAVDLRTALLGFGREYLQFIVEYQVLHADDAAAPARPRNAALDLTRNRLAGYFDAPAVHAQLRADLDSTLAASHFIACIGGELLWCSGLAGLPGHIDLFLRAVLRSADLARPLPGSDKDARH